MGKVLFDGFISETGPRFNQDEHVGGFNLCRFR